MLRFHHFSKSYDHRLIIGAEALSLHAPCYWLRGGNGSGKTTLMQAVAGIIPFAGTILLHDLTARKDTVAYRMAVNYAAAAPVYPDFLTGHDLISFYTETKKGTPDQAAALTELFGMGDYLHTKTGTYSSGMKKKLSLALAFVGRPRLILLDEPLVTLDTHAVDLLLQLLETKVAEGIQLIITSHQDLPVVSGLRPVPLAITAKQLVIA